jgi:solute carrier family 35 protein E1
MKPVLILALFFAVFCFCTSGESIAPVSQLRTLSTNALSTANLFDVQCAKTAQIAAPPVKEVSGTSLKEVVKLFVLFCLWYGFNAGYNVYNAYVKKDFPYPLATATLQLAVGLIYAFPLWMLKVRALPVLNLEDFLKLLPIGTFNYF